MNIEERIGGLERDLRHVRTAILLVLVMGGGLLLALVLPQGRAAVATVLAATALLVAAAETALVIWRMQQHVPDLIRARKFEVVDETGKVFVEIGETLEGRGAVVTHDGGTREPLHAGPATATTESRPPVATGHDENAASSPPPAREASRPRVELVYRGEGIYEARIAGGDTLALGSGPGAGERPKK